MDSFAFEIFATTTKETRQNHQRHFDIGPHYEYGARRTKALLFVDEFERCSAEVQWVHTNKVQRPNFIAQLNVTDTHKYYAPTTYSSMPIVTNSLAVAMKILFSALCTHREREEERACIIHSYCQSRRQKFNFTEIKLHKSMTSAHMRSCKSLLWRCLHTFSHHYFFLFNSFLFSILKTRKEQTIFFLRYHFVLFR